MPKGLKPKPRVPHYKNASPQPSRFRKSKLEELAAVLGLLTGELPPPVFRSSAPRPLKVGIHLGLKELSRTT